MTLLMEETNQSTTDKIVHIELLIWKSIQYKS